MVPSGRFGQIASILPDCPSTQDVLRAAAGSAAPEGFCVLADFQSEGRGRLGRGWTAAPGQCLLMSLLLRPRTPPERLAGISLVAGIAVAEAMPVPARVKWPNDVVIDGAKVAGILAELELPPGGDPFVLLGIGVNVNVPATDLPPTERLPATSLLVETGALLDRLSLFGDIIDRLQAAYGEFEELGLRGLRDRWDALDDLRDRPLSVQLGGRVVEGRGAGIDDDGRLLVVDDDDAIHRIDSGEVTAVRAD